MRAHDRETGVDVALKSIGRADGDALLRFKREFRAVRDIHHENLVELLELIERGGEWFYTMEIVDGVEALDYVHPFGERDDDDESTPEPDLGRVRESFAQLARGLIALHRAGMVHRDVKPSNVLVTPRGRVVLLDFGLVASARDIYQSTDVPTAGTVAYMAPEQALGMKVEPASDWYAFGVMLFEALTGRAPYEGMTLEIILAKAQRAARAPRDLAPSVPDDLSRLCVRLLAAAPEDRPNGDEILAVLTGREVACAAEPPGEPAFVGRESELAVLQGAAGRAFSGDQAVVCVEGEAGSGKSALVAAFASTLRAAMPELVVLRSRCDPRERLPYQGLDGVIDGLSSYLRRRGTAHTPLSSAVLRLSRVFPVLRRVPTARAAPFEPYVPREPEAELAEVAWALRSLLASVAAAAPVLVVLEDAHDLDQESEKLLAEVTRPPNAPPILLVITRRSAGDRAADIALGPLPPAEAQELARRRSRAGTLVDAAAVARASGGRPLLLEELVALAEREGVAAPTLEDLGRARAATPDDNERLLVELCAIAREDVPRAVVVAACGGAPEDVDRRLRVLLGRRVLRLEGRANAFVLFHPSIGDAALDGLDAPTFAALHRRLADAYDALEGPPRRRVQHRLAAGEPERAASIALELAEALDREGAHGEAAELYGAAIDIAPAAPGAPDGRYFALGRALAALGKSTEAAAAFLEAAGRASSADSIEHRRRAAEQLAFSGRVDEGRALFAELMHELGARFPRTSPLARLSVLSLEAWLRFRGKALDGHGSRRAERNELEWSVLRSASFALALTNAAAGVSHVPWALRLALKFGDPPSTAVGLAQAAVAIAFWTGARVSRTASLVARARTLAEEVGSPVVVGMVANCAGITHALHGEWAAADEAFRRAAEVHASGGPDVHAAARMAQGTVLQSLFWLGRFDELRARAAAAREEAAGRGDRLVPVRLELLVAPVVACMDDRPGAGLEVAEAALAEWPDLGVEQRQTFLRTRAWVHAYEGRFDLARDVLRERPKLARAPYRLQVIRISMLALEALVTVAAARSPDERRDAERLATRATKKLEAERSGWASAHAASVRAATSAALGDPERAALLFEEAAAGFTGCALTAHALACRRHAGVLLGATETDSRLVGASSYLRSQGIARPDRFCAMLVPFAEELRARRS